MTVSYSFADGVARITLDDGDRGNPIHQDSVGLLRAAVRRSGADRARVILLTASGRFFSVGGDISRFGAAEDIGSLVDDLAEDLHRTVSDLVRSPAIVVSAVQGMAAGAGFPLAAAADVVLAARSARFTLGYTKIGFSVDGGTSLLVHTLGLHRALRLALLNDVITAEEAYAAGLVARVVEDDELAATAGPSRLSWPPGPRPRRQPPSSCCAPRPRSPRRACSEPSRCPSGAGRRSPTGARECRPSWRSVRRPSNAEPAGR